LELIHDDPTDAAERSKCECNALEPPIENKMAINRDDNVILSMLTALFAENSRSLAYF